MNPAKAAVILAGIFVFAVIAWEAVDYFWQPAGTAVEPCQAEAGELGNFQATRPAQSLPEVEFVDAEDTPAQDCRLPGPRRRPQLLGHLVRALRPRDARPSSGPAPRSPTLVSTW